MQEQSKTYLGDFPKSKSEVGEKKKFRKPFFILLAVAVFSFIVGVMIGFMPPLFQMTEDQGQGGNTVTSDGSSSTTTSTSTQTTSSTAASSTTSSAAGDQNPTANWKTFTNTNPALTIKYPNEWTLDSSKSVYGTNNVTSVTTLTKSGYTFSLALPQNFGPSMCYYSDSPRPAGQVMGRDVAAYVEIIANDGTKYRRDAAVTEQSYRQYNICKQDTSGGYTSAFTPNYTLPASGNDATIIAEMDLILKNLHIGN